MKQNIMDVFLKLSTPLIADACVRLNIPLRIAGSCIRPVCPSSDILFPLIRETFPRNCRPRKFTSAACKRGK